MPKLSQAMQNLKIPKADKDGWFNAKDCKPPVGRTVELGASKDGQITAKAEAYFNGINWICNAETIEQPEFWRMKR